MTRFARPILLLAGGFLLAVAASRGADKAKAEPAGQGRVAAGEYVEVDESGTPNPLLGLRVAEVTPNIVEVRGANGWVAYASYDEAAKEYRGCFEWQTFGPRRSPPGKWADLFQVRLTRTEGGRIRVDGKSKENDFVIRAVKP